MIVKLLRNKTAHRKLFISAAEPLHFDSSITRFIKSGSKCRIRRLGGSYKLLRGHPPSPQVIRSPKAAVSLCDTAAALYRRSQ